MYKWISEIKINLVNIFYEYYFFLKIYGMENTEFDFCTIAHVKVGLMVGNYVSVRGSRFGEIIW